MDHRNVGGKILYIGDDGKERGREWFSFTHNEDGHKTLRAVCEIDDTEVIREVTYTMNEFWKPLDCFNRLHVEGKFLGTGWVWFTETHAECEVYNTSLGRVSQSMPTVHRANSLVVHPLTCDVLHCAAYDHDKDRKIQHIDEIISTSPLPNGASGPFLSKTKLQIEYMGRETITVRAGTFDVDHYVFPLKPNPDGSKRMEQCWCLPDQYVLVKVSVHGFLKNSTYELCEIEM